MFDRRVDSVERVLQLRHGLFGDLRLAEVEGEQLRLDDVPYDADVITERATREVLFRCHPEPRIRDVPTAGNNDLP
ncbi:hypothetical protein [Dactylosporangium sp. CA-092794]|uniref:hypothetical protein n=1 Tax=Dactylosporangium sp. CA-092794 TaxID=3239929 RepID=UPI003D9457EB